MYIQMHWALSDSQGRETNMYLYSPKDGPHTARAFYAAVFTRYGFPRNILADRGTNFLGALLTELNQILKIKKLTTMAYRQQCKGHAESFKDTLVTPLTMYVKTTQDRWDDYLSSILFAYRTSTASLTEETLFMLIYSQECTLTQHVSLLPLSKVPRSEKEHKDLLVDNLVRAHKIASERSTENKKKAMKERYHRNTAEPKFKEGDLVLLYDPTKKKGPLHRSL